MDFPSSRAFKGGWWRERRRRHHFLQGWRYDRSLRSNFSRRRWRNSLRFVFIIGVFLVFYFFLSRLRFFEVKRVICQGESHPSGAVPYWCPLLQAEFLNRNFFFLDFAGTEKRFESNFPEFARLFLQRDFPSTVRGWVQEREPLAFVVSSKSSFEATPSAETLLAAGAYFVDEDGYLFRRSSPVQANLPYLRYTENGELGQVTRLSGVFWQFSLKMLGGLKRLGLVITAVGQSDKGWLEMYVRSGPVIYLSPAEKLDKTLAVLQLVIEKYRIEGKGLKKIDLRFREPVVDY